MTSNQAGPQKHTADTKIKSKLPRNVALLLGWFIFVFAFFNGYLALSGLVPSKQFLRFLTIAQPTALLFFVVIPLGVRWLNQSRLVVHALKSGEHVPDKNIQTAQEGLLAFPQKMALACLLITIIVSIAASVLSIIFISLTISRAVLLALLGSLTGMIVGWGIYFGVKVLSRENAIWLMHEISLRGLPRQGRPFPLSAKVFTGIIILVFYLLSLFAVMIHYKGEQGAPLGPSLYIILVGGTVCLVFAWFLTNDFVYSLRDLNRFVAEVAGGNFDAECRFITEDEIGDVEFAALQMARNLKHSWTKSAELMDKMLATARQLEEEVKMGLDESMKQAQQAMEQSATIHEVSATADEVAATGNTISDSIQWVAELSKGTLDSCRRGQDDAEMAGQTIEQLQTYQSALRSELESLLHRSSRIREIIALIQGVVDQVDMLAVNAALEAAGAGEAGMRFSVVAKETKRLAGQTSAAVSDVRMILREIQDAINEFQRRHSQAMEAIEHQSGMVLDTAAALHEIVGLMEKTATSAEQIRIGSGQQTEALNEVQRILSELNVSSESIAKGSGRVEKIMQDISNLARELRAVQKAETGIPGQEESESQQSESQAPLNKE